MCPVTLSRPYSLKLPKYTKPQNTQMLQHTPVEQNVKKESRVILSLWIDDTNYIENSNSGLVFEFYNQFEAFRAILRAASDGLAFLCRMVSKSCQNMVWGWIYGNLRMSEQFLDYI